MIKVLFERENRLVEIAPGATLLEAARKAGVEVHRHAGPGHHCYDPAADCTTCAVRPKLGVNGLSERSGLERGLPVDLRLACQTKVYADAVVATLDEVQFMPDTAAPSWGMFSGAESGVALPLAQRVARA
jgi:ferredoxin